MVDKKIYSKLSILLYYTYRYCLRSAETRITIPIPSPAGRTLEDLKTSPLGVLILLRVADKPFESCLDSVDDRLQHRYYFAHHDLNDNKKPALVCRFATYS